MPKFTLIKPLDQPSGSRRLLAELKSGLLDSRFNEFKLIAAYAKSGPLHRLRDYLEQWKDSGNSSKAIFGLDQQGTSKEALGLALELFDEVYVTQEPSITFHPKIYLFNGPSHAHAFIGSNNLTIGGTEKNFESAVHIELVLPSEFSDLQQIEDCWNQLLPLSCPATIKLDSTHLQELIIGETVIAENAMNHRTDRGGARMGRGDRAHRARLIIKPESPLPSKRPTENAKAGAKLAPSNAPAPIWGEARGFVIQIKPHQNGEIFLSVTAVFQNPSFFGWPFTGRTTPKKSGNLSYPQRDPDPVVNITVYGAAAGPISVLNSYNLNTVYYEANSEFRITAAPLVEFVPEYSVMIMEPSESMGIDYDIEIHRPDSLDYNGWVEACNQVMPGGGKRPRKYGWF